MTEPKYTPAYDNKIYQKFSQKTIQNKVKNKIAFCQDGQIPYDKGVPLFCISFSLTDKNNLEIVQTIIEGLLGQPVQLAVNTVGTEKYQKFFNDLATRYPQKMILVPNSDESKRRMYAASDATLITGNTAECLQECKQAMQYGAVPISPASELVEDYNPNQERGNAFVYAKDSSWSFFAAIVRALENFRFPFDWRNIQAEAMGKED